MATTSESSRQACPFCGRTDVPICDRCGNRVPHGVTPGTWLPCDCNAQGSGLEAVCSPDTSAPRGGSTARSGSRMGDTMERAGRVAQRGRTERWGAHGVLLPSRFRPASSG